MLAFVAAAILVPGLAWSETEAAGSVFERARAAFERGLELLERKQHREAAASFTESLALRESPAALYNLAIAEQRSGRPSRALDAIERWRTLVNPERLQPGELEAAEVIRRELEAAVAMVTLDVRGGAERVLAGDREVARGDGSITVRLDPGACVLEARRSGHEPVREALVLRAGERRNVTLAADRAPLDGRLTVHVDPADAAIAIDGANRGRGRFTGAVPPGEHGLAVTRDGYVPHAERIAIAPGGEAERRIVLEPEPSILSAWWFWAVLGAVAVAGGAAAIAVTSGPEPYDGGTVGQTVEALR